MNGTQHDSRGRGRHVLVVEDDRSLREVMAETLADEGFRVSIAADGLQALDMARQDTPGLVFLDLTLPLLDGQEFAEAWRTAVPGARVPIVLVTGAATLPPHLDELGVRESLSKPFDMDKLIDVADRLAVPGVTAAV